MKLSHIIIGAGVAVGVVVLYKRFAASSAPTQTTGGKVGGVVDGVQQTIDSLKSLFIKTAPGPAVNRGSTQESVDPGSLNYDAYGDQSGVFATNVIEFRPGA